MSWLDNDLGPVYQEGGAVVDQYNGNTSDTSMWDYEVSQNTGFKYTPEQLGWSPEEADKFRDAGNDMLPGFMAKDLIYSSEFKLNGKDPIATYNTLATGDVNQLSGELDGARKAKQYLEGSGGDLSTAGDAGKEAFVRSAFGTILNGRDSWWDRNKGAVIGIGGMLTVGLGGYLSGAMALGDAALAGGMTAAEASAMAGESAAGYGAAGAAGAGAGGSGWLGALEGGMGAYGASGAGSSGSLSSLGIGTTEGFGALGGDVMGFNNATPLATGTAETSGITDAIAAGQAAGADVGMGAGTSWLTDLGLPASYGSGLGGLTDYAGSMLGAGSTASGGSSIWDSITNLLSPNGGSASPTGGTDWSKLLGPLLGVGGAVAGGVMGNNAIQDSIDKMQKYYQPFYDLGVSNIAGLNAADPTGGSGQFIDQLKNYGTNFQFDYNNPAYTQQLAETTRLNDQNLAARGMYNSRAGLNLQDQSQRNLVSTEFDKQYTRGYSNLTDLFGMTNTNAGTSYNKLLDMVKIGAGSAGSAGQGALASGQSSANLYSGLGTMPMNYAILSKLLGGK